MAVKMDQKLVRRKIVEVEGAIAEMKRKQEPENLIRIEERKLMVLKKWLEPDEEKI